MASLKSQFYIDQKVTFLNYGSFGGTPKPIMKNYQDWQLECEREPVQFMQVNLHKYLRKSREALAKYINCNADDLVYVTNPSYAINIIAKSLKLTLGDQVLTTDLEYGAIDRTWKYYTRKTGAKYFKSKISLPVKSTEQFIEDLWKGYSHKTKVVFISHITSSTGMILPVKEICEMAKAKGLITIVDGAHVPGHIPLNLQELKADIYTGACHKWMMTPKGSSFLYVKKELQDRFDPLLISWGYESDNPSASRFQDYHSWQGTRDMSAFLTIPASIKFMKDHNWKKVSDACKKLVHDNYETFCDVLGTQPLCPVNKNFLGQMGSAMIKTHDPAGLQRKLFTRYKVDLPVMKHDDYTFIRFSIQAYNSQKDLDKLFDALKKTRGKEHG
ncbi:MAG TPA: aminotransferase class V-fold PLP-dependent enzyme [Flavobacteriales bacterium]|nr:aminotransferase class V-fold PLP-dependent enzyme [Flavobacteriales bacterium]